MQTNYRLLTEKRYRSFWVTIIIMVIGFSIFRFFQLRHDPVEAFKSIRKEAELGNIAAECALGLCYHKGDGVSQNDAEAIAWLQKSANHGYDKAQYCLGVIYYEGKSFPQNFIEAAKWFRKAAEQGDAFSQYYLSYFYYNSYAVPKDDVEAYKWICLAAASGKNDIIKFRDALASHMSPEQIAEGKKRAAEFVPKKSSRESE